MHLNLWRLSSWSTKLRENQDLVWFSVPAFVPESSNLVGANRHIEDTSVLTCLIQLARLLVGQCTQPLPYWSSCSRVRLANSYYDWFCPSRNKESSYLPKPPGLNNYSYFDGEVLLTDRGPLLKKNSFSMVTSIKYWNKHLSSWMIRSLGRQGRVLQSWLSNIQ